MQQYMTRIFFYWNACLAHLSSNYSFEQIRRLHSCIMREWVQWTDIIFRFCIMTIRCFVLKEEKRSFILCIQLQALCLSCIITYIQNIVMCSYTEFRGNSEVFNLAWYFLWMWRKTWKSFMRKYGTNGVWCTQFMITPIRRIIITGNIKFIAWIENQQYDCNISLKVYTRFFQNSWF